MTTPSTAAPSTTAAKDPAEAVFAWFRTMLDTQPVLLENNQLWQVFSYADVSRILSDPATFSSDITSFGLFCRSRGPLLMIL